MADQNFASLSFPKLLRISLMAVKLQALRSHLLCDMISITVEKMMELRDLLASPGLKNEAVRLCDCLREVRMNAYRINSHAFNSSIEESVYVLYVGGD